MSECVWPCNTEAINMPAHESFSMAQFFIDSDNEIYLLLSQSIRLPRPVSSQCSTSAQWKSSYGRWVGGPDWVFPSPNRTQGQDSAMCSKCHHRNRCQALHPISTARYLFTVRLLNSIHFFWGQHSHIGIPESLPWQVFMNIIEILFLFFSRYSSSIKPISIIAGCHAEVCIIRKRTLSI